MKLLSIGQDQVVRIPREFELTGHSATMKQIGKTLIVEPKASTGLLNLLATLEPIDAEFAVLTDLQPDIIDL